MELDFRKDPTILTSIVDAMADGLFTVDAQGRFVAWSQGAERITGYRSDEIVGQPCHLLEGPNCKGFATLAAMLQSESPPPQGICNQECKLLAKDGRELFIHGNVRTILDDSGRIAGAVGTFSDVTTLLEANQRIALLEEQTRQRDSLDRLVGHGQAMQEVFRRIRLAADSDVTVFISGESGTGKELAARAVHQLSDRRDAPFIAVNCSAIPETLLESELFGHVRGAFTGAVRDKVGMFQAADGGTLFLDEIGDLSPLLQLKLLRVLQEREVRRVGDDQPRSVNVRLVTATNRDLKQLIADGNFREDFYYRIHVFEIAMPPLRDRREDLPLLVEHFISEFSAGRQTPVTGIARDAMQKMMSYSWPGNVRELRNAIEHAFVTVAGQTIKLLDLPPELREVGREAPRSRNVSTPPGTRYPQSVDDTELSDSQRAERDKIVQTLQETNGNRTAAAKLLGTSRVTLWKKLKRYGLSEDSR